MRFPPSLFLPAALIVAGIPTSAATITGGTVLIIFYPETSVNVTFTQGPRDFSLTGARDDSGYVSLLGYCSAVCEPGLLVNPSGSGFFQGGTFLLNGSDISSTELFGRLDFTAAPFEAQLGTITGPFTASGYISCDSPGCSYRLSQLPLSGSGTFSVTFLEQPFPNGPRIRAPVITYTFITPEPSTWLLLSAGLVLVLLRRIAAARSGVPRC